MAGKITHREKNITIIHNIDVDACIADEIERLNNKNNIFTLSSCCGHGLEAGYIIVAGSEIENMMRLGYDTIALKYLDNEVDLEKDRIVICAFRPKSKCICYEK